MKKKWIGKFEKSKLRKKHMYNFIYIAICTLGMSSNNEFCLPSTSIIVTKSTFNLHLMLFISMHVLNPVLSVKMKLLVYLTPKKKQQIIRIFTFFKAHKIYISKYQLISNVIPLNSRKRIGSILKIF